MSFDFSASANHADGPAGLKNSPGWAAIWVKCPTALQFRRFLTIFSAADTTQMTAISTSAAATDTAPGFYIEAGSATSQSAQSGAMTVGQWYCLLYGLADTNHRNFQATGLAAISRTGVIVPANLDTLILSGRPGDHSQNAGSLMAHAALGTARDMTATEKLYILGGGSLRAISNLTDLYKCNRQVSGKIPDEIGGRDLTITGVMTAGGDDPVVATWMTAGPIANLVLKVGTAANVNLGAPFDNVNSAFTCAILQLGAPTLASTAASASSSGTGNEIALLSAAAFSVGDYIQIGSQTPAPVLFVNAGSGIVLFDGPVAWAAGDSAFRIPVSTRAIAGTSITSNVLGGPPTTPASYVNCVVRATCNANAALFGDSNLLNIQVSGVASSSLLQRRKPRRVYVKVFSRR